ncbi:MAG: hypothetical protein M3506_06870 [Chloroflexota bacterium]|nr:hypothetical protein [Chloroflexota bacterium]
MQARSDNMSFYRTVFRVGAVYDMLLGASFFFFWKWLFNAIEVVPPENTSYIHITAAYVFMQGLGYWFVARDMLRNIDIVKLGVIYKLIYVALSVYYLAIGELLHAVFVWFAVVDLIFLVLFAAFLRRALPLAGRGRANV